MLCVLLLTISNIFMTIAWYGHLKHGDRPLWIVILVSWGIAFFEYCFQVPANRIGYRHFSGYQLKIIQEVITLTVFVLFAAFYLKEGMRWNYAIGLALLVAAVVVIFSGKKEETEKDAAQQKVAASLPTNFPAGNDTESNGCDQDRQ